MKIRRPKFDDRTSDKRAVASILEQVKKRGDAALREYAKKFDGLDTSSFKVPRECLEKAVSSSDSAIFSAFNNLKEFHQLQIPSAYSFKNTQGVTVGTKWQAINRVGLYIPGGQTPLVSTVLMLGVPAMLAGVKEIALITPAKNPLLVNEDILFAANLCGINEVYTIGGAQGIAALGYGTETVKKVDKIFGPGSFYVDQAKRLISIDTEGAAIDMAAGPSEVLVIADENANPRFIASDLLAQLEHGVDSQAVLLSTSEALLGAVKKELTKQNEKLSRADVLKESVTNTVFVKTKSLDEALKISEDYAPEHLIIQTARPYDLLDKVSNAGSIFLGAYTPETLGDYMSGTNHVLPTSGFARAQSGLGVLDFLRKVTFQEACPDSLLRSKDDLYALTDIEGLDAHRNAVTVRLEGL